MIRFAMFASALAVQATPASAAWYEARSRHFIIYADQKPDKLETFARNLEKFDSAVRVARGVEDPPIGDALRLTIFMFGDAEAISRLHSGKETGVAGFYLPRAQMPVAFVPARTDGESITDLVFFHEYAHHLMNQNLDSSYPAWVTEGFAEFFGTAQFPKSGEVRLGSPARDRANSLRYLPKPPIEALVGGTFRQKTTADAEGLYSWGWLLTHYLAFEPSRKGQQAAYLAAIRSGKTPLEAARSAFGDLAALDRDLDRYLRRDRFSYLNFAGPEIGRHVGTVTVRPVSPGMQAMMPTRIRSVRGVTSKTAPEVAVAARLAAAPYPNDPDVQTALAEAEFDVDQYAAAEAAADRALKVNPANSAALIYKARSQMERARANRDKADWKTVRALLGKANRLDREDPEPLILFYESYQAAGEKPTKNAVEGLLYAQLLAPQDKGLRLNAVMALIDSGRLIEARNTMAPLAGDPHSSDSVRDGIRAALAALDRKDGKLAAQLIEKAYKKPEAQSS